MVEFDIVIKDSASNGYRQKASQIDSKLKGLSSRVVNVIHRWVQREAPRKTGRLKSSIQKTSSVTGGAIFMGKGAPYFIYVLDGHRTRPRKHAAELTFLGKSTGFKQGQHWVNGNPYIDRGLDKSEASITNEVQKFVDWLES